MKKFGFGFNKETLSCFIKENAIKIVIAVTLSIALISSGAYAWHCGNQNYEREQAEIKAIEDAQREANIVTETAGFDFSSLPYIQMGYSNIDEYWTDVQALRAEVEGLADDMIARYGAYMTDEQENLLREYEKDMLNAIYVEDFETAMTNFNDIIAACMPRVFSGSGGGYSGGNYSGSFKDFMRDGVIYYNGNKYTYYSQRVLPGGGLDIPGRHTEGGFVRDGDGYIVIASDQPNGTVIETPFGYGKVYDSGTSGNHYDIYVE